MDPFFYIPLEKKKTRKSTPSSQLPTPNSQITNHKSQITNHNSQITNHNSQITNHKSQITNHKSQITNHKKECSLEWILCSMNAEKIWNNVMKICLWGRWCGCLITTMCFHQVNFMLKLIPWNFNNCHPRLMVIETVKLWSIKNWADYFKGSNY